MYTIKRIWYGNFLRNTSLSVVYDSSKYHETIKVKQHLDDKLITK